MHPQSPEAEERLSGKGGVAQAVGRYFFLQVKALSVVRSNLPVSIKGSVLEGADVIMSLE